jgi:hypothetical protein
VVHVKLIEEVTIFNFSNFEFIHVLGDGLDLLLGLEVRFLIPAVSRSRLGHRNAVDSAEGGTNKSFKASD